MRAMNTSNQGTAISKKETAAFAFPLPPVAVALSSSTSKSVALLSSVWAKESFKKFCAAVICSWHLFLRKGLSVGI